MYFIALALSLVSVSFLASAAPVPVRRAAKRDDITSNVHLPSPDSFQIPGVNSSDIIANISTFVPRATAMVDVDQSCSKNTSDILGALSYALYMADMARGVQADDIVYQTFFLPEEIQSVQSMFGAMVSKNASDKSDGKIFKVTCPAEGEYNFPNNTNATTDSSSPDLPQIRLSANLFTTNDTASGAGLSLVLLQEMTHIETFSTAANLSSQSCGDSASNSTGTCDILLQDDEKNPGKKYSDVSTSPIELAVCLRRRWAAYNNQTSEGLNKPPMVTDKNAGNYAGFGSLYMAEKLTSSNEDASGMFMLAIGMMSASIQNC